MNIRKTIDYSAMYAELNEVLSANLPQMEEIYAIGRAICKRPEKGAAVMAAEYLQKNSPDRSGFSPRNVRRMRDFYRTYENDETLLRLALKIGWTLNVVIMEADLTHAERKWYLEQARIHRWTKAQISEAIQENVYQNKLTEETTQPLKHSAWSWKRILKEATWKLVDINRLHHNMQRLCCQMPLRC